MEIVIGYSDALDIKVHHKQTRLFKYSNDIEYAGLDYSSNQNFNIRVKSKFYEPRLPEENESEPLSDGRIAKLSSTVKQQKLLQLIDLPPHMHVKMQLVLQHNSIYEGNESYIKEENYELQAPLHDKAALFDAQVYLTLQ